MANNLTVAYKGSTIHSASASGSATLETGGTWCEDDIELSYTFDGGFSPQLIVIGPATGSTVVASFGGESVTLTESSGTWTGNLTDYGMWTVTASNSQYTISDTVNVTEVRQYTLEIRPSIYGVYWDGSSTTILSRTDDAASFTDPVPYVNGANNYGSPFDSISPWKDMTIINDEAAGALVKIPKFWYKLTQSGNDLSVKIASYPADGFSVCPACMNRGDGAGERDYIYVGRYHCATDNYKSKTSIKPKSSISRATARTAIHNLGTNIWQMDYTVWFTICLLYIVEYANWNTQVAIGYGSGNNSSTENMGYTDSMPYHTGTTKNSRTTYGLGIQYRNIEGLWDNVCDYVDGVYLKMSSGAPHPYFIINPSGFSDTTGGTMSYNAFSHTGFIKYLRIDTTSFPKFYPYPSNDKGSNTTYIPDESQRGDSSKPCVRTGGTYYQDLGQGLFFFGVTTTDAALDFVGCRLMKLP